MGKRDKVRSAWNRTWRFCSTMIHSKQEIHVSLGQQALLFSFVLAGMGGTNLAKNTLGWLMQHTEISGAFAHNKALLLDHLLSSECLCMFTTPCFACCAACMGGCVCTCHSFTQEIDASSVICSCSAAWRQFSSAAVLLHASLLAHPSYNTDFFLSFFGLVVLNSEVM